MAHREFSSSSVVAHYMAVSVLAQVHLPVCYCYAFAVTHPRGSIRSLSPSASQFQVSVASIAFSSSSFRFLFRKCRSRTHVGFFTSVRISIARRVLRCVSFAPLVPLPLWHSPTLAKPRLEAVAVACEPSICPRNQALLKCALPCNAAFVFGLRLRLRLEYFSRKLALFLGDVVLCRLTCMQQVRCEMGRRAAVGG